MTVERKPFAVSRRNIDAALADLPLPGEFASAGTSFDAFIGAAGFEERVLGIPRAIVAVGGRILGPILLGHYQTNDIDNASRGKELLPLLRQLGEEPIYFEADSPEDTLRTIKATLATVAPERELRILLDISGASSTLIFAVMATLASLPRQVCLTIGYAAAINYHDPGVEARTQPVGQWDQTAMRERGVREVDTNELYRGIHHDHLPGFVIAFPSMYCARLQRCLSHLGVGPLSGATESIFWVLPKTEDQAHQWRQYSVKQALCNLIYGDDLAGAQNLPNGQHVYCDVWDYLQAARIVLEQVDRPDGANMSVIHMGTKIQAIGVALALLGRPEVSLVSARPESFAATNYSDGIGMLQQITIPNLQASIRHISEVGMLDVTPKT